MDKSEATALIKELNKASEAYYNTGHPIMSDYDFDKKIDMLKKWEEESGIVMADSPTHKIGYIVSDELKEVTHNHPMLSLDKTKSASELADFVGNNECILSVKCDGLTTSLRYANGKLVSAETRGNGLKGFDCLQNVLTMNNVPKEIPYKDNLIIDGESIVGWDTFRRINDSILDESKKYKHPRNLASGSLGLLDSKEAASRNMRFVAWRVIKGFEHKSVYSDLKRAESNGFEVVPMWFYSNKLGKEMLSIMLDQLKEKAESENIPYDGAVMAVDDYSLAESMGRTDKFFRHSISYKYEDDLFDTVLTDIEWNTSKTGLINPVAIFKPVDLNGAVTTRATLHNITYIKDMMLGIGDRIRIYRSNMVIPKVHESIDKSGHFEIPSKCPACGAPTKIAKENDSETLYCTNENCKGRLLGKLSHAASRNALNIDGLSEATIKKFIEFGWLDSIESFFHLSDHKSEISHLSGFGKKSTEKLLVAIESCRHTTLDRFLYALSIPMVGKTVSKQISDLCDGNFEKLCTLITLHGASYFNCLDGVGDSITSSLNSFWNANQNKVINVSKNFVFEENQPTETTSELFGKTFCVTGSLKHFSNRDELKQRIKDMGGKVSDSVTGKTSFLINNDSKSTSGKNKKAHELNIPIITEEQFLEMIGGN
jgi:DNA ligase (NAD+)